MPGQVSCSREQQSLYCLVGDLAIVPHLGLDVVKLGDVDGGDPGEPAAAPQRARQLRHGLAAELGDVLGAGVHVGELHLGHLLRGQTVAGHGAVVVPRHGPAPVLVELEPRVPLAPAPAPALTPGPGLHYGLQRRHRRLDLVQPLLRVELGRVEPQLGGTHE